MQQDFSELREVLLRTLSHNNTHRRQAEKYVEDASAQDGFGITLLQFIKALTAQGFQPHSQEAAVCHSAATTFKNLVKQRWAPDTEDQPLSGNDKQLIKDHLLEMMCTSPPDVQRMLSEALAIISKHDFPQHWEGLLPQIVEGMKTQDPYIIHALMMTANSIFKRFRFVEQSDALLVELKYVLDMFQRPFMTVFETMAGAVDNQGMSADETKLVFETLRLMARIFFSLNWQDLPEFFEDSMARWTEQFGKLLSNNYEVQPSNEDESGPVERLQAAIVECLNIYATKYEDEFQPYLGNFAQAVWHLLVRTGREPRFDVLATTSIQFLNTVVSKPINAGMFSEQNLQEFVQSIVVPNLTVGEVDEELFEMNPTEYIRKDLEGSDVDTRRRSASELVRGMCRNFEQQTTQLCLGYITEMLQQYAATPNNWRLKDSALQLAVAVAVRAQTVGGGVTQLNPGIDILAMFNQQIFPEVQDADIHSRPIVKADALKFISLFRSQMPADMMLQLLPDIIKFLGSTSVVVQTYAAYTIERFLSLKDTQPDRSVRPRLSVDAVLPFLEPLFSGLFTVLDNDELPENEYVMKAIMRTLLATGPAVASVTGLVLEKLTLVLGRVAANPRNPYFNHYIFESIGILIKSVCESNPAHVGSFESALFPPFEQILQNDIVEFIPYVFQVFAHLLFFQPAGHGISAAYQGLFAPCLSPALWERKGNVPALTELMKAYIMRGLDFIVRHNHLEAVLGIFQRMLGNRASETSAFALVDTLVSQASLDMIAPYMSSILQLIVSRMQANKTPRMFKLGVTFFCTVAVSFGPAVIEQTLDGLHPGLLGMLVEQTWIPTTSVLVMSDRTDAKVIVAGGARILTETAVRQNHELFAALFSSLLEVSDPLSAAQASVELMLDEEEDRTFDATYSRLAFSRIPSPDPLPDVTDLGVALVAAVGKLIAFEPGVPYAQVLRQSLNGDQSTRVTLHLRNGNVSW